MFSVSLLTLSEVPNGKPMELVLGNNHIVDLGGRKHLEELIVISLYDAALFQLQFITFLYGLLTASLVGRLIPAHILHLIPDGALLLLHLPVKWEELGSLFGCQRSLLGDKLLHVGLEFLGRELLGIMGHD